MAPYIFAKYEKTAGPIVYAIVITKKYTDTALPC